MGKYLLVTGKIAAPALQKTVAGLTGHDLEIAVLPQGVAALLTTTGICSGLSGNPHLASGYTVLIPGLAEGPLEEITQSLGVLAERGPADLKDLPAYLSGEQQICRKPMAAAVTSPIKIVAEIVDAPRLSHQELVAAAAYYSSSGADYIDLGGSVGYDFPHLDKAIAALKAEGYRVCVDSHREADIRNAAQAGVDIVLSFTSQNLHLARLFSCPVVVIPDDGADMDSLYRNMEQLAAWNVDFIADPILPPLTLGLADALVRYHSLRQRYPYCPILMGLGNVSELTDADSVGLNALMVGIATELRIDYLLSTEVGNRCRGAIRELALARDLCQLAVEQGIPPKHLDYRLLTIKDAHVNTYTRQELRVMQHELKAQDHFFRIFVSDQIYMFNGSGFYQGRQAEELYRQIPAEDSAHSFYLGRELQKAEIALHLHKRYVQDSPLDWGYWDEQPKPKAGEKE
jgi:dihydropteroate synthase-like protein